MPASTKFVPNSDVIVPISQDVFGESDARFAVGSLGYGSAPRGYDEIFDAYLKLRANVYVDQTGSLSPDLKNLDGTETDEDDERSHHFAVIENMLGRSAVVACIRLIHKSETNVEPLPIEKFYPEVFEAEPAKLNSIEVSRFIVRTGEVSAQSSVRARLLTAALSHALMHELGPAYAVVEEGTNVSLNRTGIRTEAITEPVLVEHYNEYDRGILIDTETMAENFGGDDFVKASYIEPGNFKHYGKVRRAA